MSLNICKLTTILLTFRIRYCKMTNGRQCRFGYPKPPAERTQFQDDVCEYERTVADEKVNNYNPYLLSLFRCNMDIQYNKGPRAAYYLAKYITKFDEVVDASIEKLAVGGRFKYSTSVTSSEHFKARSVGSIEAVYNVCGYVKHSNSRNVIILSMNPPDMDRRMLRYDILELDEDDDNIFNISRLGKNSSIIQIV